MSSEGIRVRFAPSPTGFLHVGGARTALFNWLYARRHDGVFILRIEDTDVARSTGEMVRAILDGLSWLGMNHDEGPFFQSSFRAEHVAMATGLLASGRAYRCFCSTQELDRRRAAVEAAGAVWKYDRTCLSRGPDDARRRLDAGEPSCIRFLVPEGRTTFADLVHGETTFDNADIEDLVLLRTDGTPTYNLSCVSDDLRMRITHVIRGDDHISNTPKQILLYQAVGSRPPQFGHLPLILGEDRKRLSKRHGAVSVLEYREAGYLPQALFNFLALLGWSPGGDREIMTRQEMISSFSFAGVGARSAVFDHDKLAWMNGEYIKAMAPPELASLARPFLEKDGLWDEPLEGARRGWFEDLIGLLKDRVRLLPDFARDARPFLTTQFEYDPAAAAKHFAGAGVPDRLSALRGALAQVEPFEEAAAEAALRGLAGQIGLKAGDLIHPARVALTGRMVSPGIFAVMARMGRDGVLARLDRAVSEIRSGRIVAAGESPAR